MKVFVYGTLKMGYGNNRLLEDKTYVGDDVIENYKLLEHGRGGIPFAVPSEGSKIKGEVWDIEEDERCLARLDRLEGHPNFYIRTPVKTVGDQDVEFYVLNQDSSWSSNHLRDCPVNAKNEFYWE